VQTFFTLPLLILISMEENYSVFGYGSLILPQSVIGRFDEEISRTVDEALEQNDEDRSKIILETYLDLDEESWKKYEIDFIPVKIYGFKRFYELEIPGGNMLTVRKSENETDFVNGVIASGITKEQFMKIKETEKAYNTVKVSKKNIEPYLSDSELQENNIDVPETVYVFVADDENSAVNHSTKEKRNKYYHQYLLEGTDLLSKELFKTTETRKAFSEKFKKDLEQTTYEKDNGSWKLLADNEKEEGKMEEII